MEVENREFKEIEYLGKKYIIYPNGDIFKVGVLYNEYLIHKNSENYPHVYVSIYNEKNMHVKTPVAKLLIYAFTSFMPKQIKYKTDKHDLSLDNFIYKKPKNVVNITKKSYTFQTQKDLSSIITYHRLDSIEEAAKFFTVTVEEFERMMGEFKYIGLTNPYVNEEYKYFTYHKREYKINRYGCIITDKGVKLSLYKKGNEHYAGIHNKETGNNTPLKIPSTLYKLFNDIPITNRVRLRYKDWNPSNFMLDNLEMRG